MIKLEFTGDNGVSNTKITDVASIEINGFTFCFDTSIKNEPIINCWHKDWDEDESISLISDEMQLVFKSILDSNNTDEMQLAKSMLISNNIPPNPERTYKKERVWKSWGDFLGRTAD